MNKNQRQLVPALIVLAFLLLLVVSGVWFVATTPTKKNVPVYTLSNPSGRRSCSQCVGDICASASCNIECEYGEGWCNSIVMGGGKTGPFNRDEANRVGLENYDHAEFINFRIILNNEAMETAGVEVGSTVTHVDGEFVKDADRFAELVKDLRGKTLRLMKPDGTRGEVRLG